MDSGKARRTIDHPKTGPKPGFWTERRFGIEVALLGAMTTLTTTYRHDALAADLRYGDLLEKRLEELPSALAVARVRERRVGRIAAGITGIAGTLLLVIGALDLASTRSFSHGALGTVLLGTWGAMIAAYAIGRIGARILRRRPEIPRRSGDRWADVERLSEPLVTSADRRRADACEKASVALPLMAIGLLAPLSIHGVLYAGWLAADNRLRESLGFDRWLEVSLQELARFDGWIALSLAIVGHAHLVLAFLCYRFAKKVRELPLEKIHEEGKRASWAVFGWTVVASAVPGALLSLIPPGLTALTGVLFAPAMFRLMSRRVVAEREVLASAGGE